MARVAHLVITFDTNQRDPKFRVHGAWTSKHNAETYQQILNEDVMDDEPAAEIVSQYFSFLTADFMKGKKCYKVEMWQWKATKISETLKVETAPMLNTEASLFRGETDSRGRQQVIWTGWAETKQDALKRAKVRAIASWVGL